MRGWLYEGHDFLMDLHERRELLKCNPNPDPGRDYIASFTGVIPNETEGILLSTKIRFVPDRLILEPTSLNLYLAEIGNQDWSSLEELVHVVLNDIQNEVVPRWVQITAEQRSPEVQYLSHQLVIVEDRQPGWKNETLVLRQPERD